jgi:hypothetical protein
MYPYREYPMAGGLVSYGESLADPYRLVGTYVGRILKEFAATATLQLAALAEKDHARTIDPQAAAIVREKMILANSAILRINPMATSWLICSSSCLTCQSSRPTP